MIIAVGKLNHEKTFPVAFSWAPKEDIDSYNQFYRWLREEIYTNKVPEPAVVLIDQSKGIISAYNTMGCLPNS